MKDEIKSIYSELDGHWTWSFLAFGLAGFIRGAMDRFSEWGRIFNQFNLWNVSVIPGTHLEFKWSWLGIAVQILGALPALIILSRDLIRMRNSGQMVRAVVTIGTNLLIVLLSVYVVACTAEDCMGLAFGVAGVSALSVGGQALKVKLVHFADHLISQNKESKST